MVLSVIDNKRNKIEMMLFKEKHVKDENRDVIEECPTEEWIALWEDFSKEDKNERSLWRFQNPPFKFFDNTFNNLMNLKKMRPDIFLEIFDKNFVMNLITEFIKHKEILYGCTRDGIEEWNNLSRVEKFISFVHENLKENCEEKDMWEKLDQELLVPQASLYWQAHEIGGLIMLWKQCFQKKAYLDLTKMIEPKTAIFRSWPFRGYDVDSQLFTALFIPFVKAVDGFKGCEKYFSEGLGIRHLKEFTKFAEQELMYEALKKNFINLQLIDEVMELAEKEGRLDLIPLLMLKKNGQWPEDELFTGR